MALSSNKPKRVVGLDLSTNAIAFSLFVDGELTVHGKVNMIGDTVQRNYLGNRYARSLGEILQPDLIAYESAVYIQNKKTVITLAEFFGAVVSSMSRPHTQIRRFIPIEWQNFIGNKALTKAEKHTLVHNNPGKSANWQKENQRKFRKQRTMDWVNSTYHLHIDDDDISDAIAIGHTAVHKPVL